MSDMSSQVRVKLMGSAIRIYQNLPERAPVDLDTLLEFLEAQIKLIREGR